MIVGVDPASARIALVSIEPRGEFRNAVFKFATPFTPNNCYQSYTAVSDFLHTAVRPLDRERIAVVEAPVVAGARNIQSSLKQALVIGGIITAFREWEFDVTLVAISSWKKAVVGHGGADKEAIAAYLRQRWPKAAEACGNNQDLIDATCIALYGDGMVRTSRL